jgi:DNA-binding IclR family transcriptional regulator
VLRREIEPVTFCGHADIVDELEEGLARMSVAIGERGSRPVATLKVTGPSLRFDGEERIAARPCARPSRRSGPAGRRRFARRG